MGGKINSEGRRKGRLVVGNYEDLKSKLFELYHDSTMEEHSQTDGQN